MSQYLISSGDVAVFRQTGLGSMFFGTDADVIFGWIKRLREQMRPKLSVYVWNERRQPESQRSCKCGLGRNKCLTYKMKAGCVLANWFNEHTLADLLGTYDQLSSAFAEVLWDR